MVLQLGPLRLVLDGLQVERFVRTRWGNCVYRSVELSLN